jgi:serine protease Do
MRSLKSIRKKSLFILLIASLVLSGMVLENALDRLRGDHGDCFVSRAEAQELVEEELPDVIERIVPAVVNISSKKVVEVRGSHPLMDDPFFRRFFEDYFDRYDLPRERVERNLGSGVIVSRDGYILTNNHLVGEADRVLVTLPDEREFDAEIIGSDPETDVAVLKIESEDLPSVPIGDSDRLRLGQTVVAIGYPFGVGQTVTRGIVSAKSRAGLRLTSYEDFIQTDAAINPGNSGGALINARGELVGINTAILSRSGGSHGIGFAISINMAKDVMEKIIDRGRVVRGWLGVNPEDLDPQMAEFFDIESTDGVVIALVVENSPADKGGLEQNDIITEFDGEPVKDVVAFRRMVADVEPGSTVEIRVLRDGDRRTLEVEIGERKDLSRRESIQEEEGASPLFVGVSLEVLDDYYRRELNIPRDLEGLVVTDVDQTSPAAEAGLSQGDVIVEINRRKVASIQDFNEIMERSRRDKVLLLVYRGGSQSYIIIKS